MKPAETNLEIVDSLIRIGGQHLFVRWLRHQRPKISALAPLVMLHEALGSVAMWKGVPAQLALKTGRDVLVYDRIGHGRSSPLISELEQSNYHQVEVEKFLSAVLDRYGIGQAILIGHSDGGTIALLAAAWMPDRIRAVITEAAHVVIEEKTLEGIRAVLSSPDLQKLKEKVSAYHVRSIDSIFNRWTSIWLSPDFARWDMIDRLQFIGCPVLVLQGDEDEFGSDLQVMSIVDNVSGDTKSLMISGCGHVPHFQSPGVFEEEVSSFIDAL